jgi:hypothetical protein
MILMLLVSICLGVIDFIIGACSLYRSKEREEASSRLF